MKQTSLDLYFRKRKYPDSDEISCKRTSSQQQSPNDDLLHISDHESALANENSQTELSKVCSASPNDALTQDEDKNLHNNTARTGGSISPIPSQIALNGTSSQERDQNGSVIVSENVEAELFLNASRQGDDLTLHNNIVANISANALSLNGTLGKKKSDQILHSRTNATQNSEAKLAEARGVPGNDALRQEDDPVLYDHTVASTSANTSTMVYHVAPHDALVQESTQKVHESVVISTDSESETSMVYELSPNVVELIKTLPTSSKTPKRRSNNNNGTRKTSKAAAMNSVPFILHTIDQYDKYLRTSGALKGILEDDSLNLLSRWELVTEPAKIIVCYLYCIEHEEQLAMITDKMKTSEIEEIKSLLSKEGFITLCSEGREELKFDTCVEQLKLSDLLETCEKFNLKISPSKEKAKSKLRAYMGSRDIKQWFGSPNSTNINQRRLDVLKDLRSKLEMWKLSGPARETINELLILMHLDNIFNMGCTIDPTEKKNNRPAIKFKPSKITKCYPVDKAMIVDYASIVFQDRNEFCRYLEAYAFFKKYKAKKTECGVLEAYKLYTEITRNAKNMLRNWILPLWLHRFTPAYLYVKILEGGVSLLKKSKLDKKYKKPLEVLDSLISQSTFRQHKKAEWYDMKYNIQLKCLRSVTKAARTLKEACEANLPEETVYTLRHRAKRIVDKSRINPTLITALKVHADKDILENSIPNPDHFYGQPIQKTNSRMRPKYMWEEEPVKAEIFCCNKFKLDSSFAGEHWEGRIVTTMYFLLFWDIIYTKPLGATGIFISHYQQYPLDMWCESFYINRKTRIDNFLTFIEKSSPDNIVEMMSKRWTDTANYNIPDIVRSIGWDNIELVVRLLGTRALAAICRRLVQDYGYTRKGFPDLTLCDTNSIKFREVKTDNDKAHPHQMQWLHYLVKHGIDASICYLRDNAEQQPRENNDTSNSEEESDRNQIPDTEEPSGYVSDTDD